MNMNIAIGISFTLLGAALYAIYRARHFIRYGVWSLTASGRREAASRKSVESRQKSMVHFYTSEDIWGKEKRKSA